MIDVVCVEWFEGNDVDGYDIVSFCCFIFVENIRGEVEGV